MNSFSIFSARLKKDYLFQYSIIKTVADWTILLYLVIPFSAAAIIIYRSWWIELPSWSQLLSLPLITTGLFLLCWLGQIRTFVKEADGVFFIHHQQLFIGMKKWAFMFTLLKSSLKMILAGIITLPFLYNMFSLNIIEIIGYLLFYIGLSFFVLAVQTRLLSEQKGLKGKLYFGLTFVLMLICNYFLFSHLAFKPLYAILVFSLFLILSLQFFIPRIRSTKHIQEEFTQENKVRLRYMNLIFSVAPELEKPKIIKRRRPFLFRKSARIFSNRSPKNGFIELFFKIIIRNFSYLGGYFQLFTVTLGALIILPPILFKVIIVIGFIFFIQFWISNLWDRVVLSHPIGKQYEGHEAFYLARKQAVLFLTVPPVVILVSCLTVLLV